MLIPLVSTAVALTLLPVVLATVGRRLDWPHRRTDDKASRAWTRWAELVVRRRWLAAGVSLAIVAALVVAAANIQLGQSDLDTIAKQGDAKAGLEALKDSDIGAGALLPHEVLVAGHGPRGRSRATWTASPASTGPWLPTRARGGRTAPRSSRSSPRPTARPRSRATRSTACAKPRTAPDPTCASGGNLALNDDFIEAVYGNFPLMIALIGIITFILLARAFRSLLLPAKAVAAERPEHRRRLGRAGRGLAARLGLRGDLGHRVHGLGAVLDPADDLRVPVRALDGLRGVHPGPHAGGVRRDGLHCTRRSCAASAAPGGWSRARR